MGQQGNRSLWASDPPEDWPKPPELMTVSALAELESCPRRWALQAAAYPQLWNSSGYPPRVHLSAIAGTVLHSLLQKIVQELVKSGCASVGDQAALQVMKSLGGFTALVNDAIDRVLVRLRSNPRATSIIEHAERTLRAQVPELRTRAQIMLARLRMPSTTSAQRKPRQTDGTRGPLPLGVFSELELRASTMGYRGRADLLKLSSNCCELTDFKTGAQDDAHMFQIRVYSLLWSRDEELNPNGRLADRLILSYDAGELEVAALTESELDILEQQLVTRRLAVQSALERHPPEPRPSFENCRYCAVRHLCDAYWSPQAQGDMAATTKRNFADAQLRITARHGPTSWDSLIEHSGDIAYGTPALLRTVVGIEFQLGDRLRVLDAAVSGVGDNSTQPLVFTLGTLSEVYTAR